MKLNQMVALVNELIVILKHNEYIINESKKIGYKGYEPDYKGWQILLKETTGTLEALDDVCNEKLEEVCAHFCQMLLANGAMDDEWFLCRLTQISPENPFLEMVDGTNALSTKYNLKVLNSSDDSKFHELFEELQSETRVQSGMRCC